MPLARTALFALGLAALTLPAAAAAPGPLAQGWTVDHSASTLGYTGVTNEGDFDGRFGTWSAAINFDPVKLDQSRAEVTIDTGSANSGDPSRDAPLKESAWFDVAAFPTATFVTDSITVSGDGSYVADGTLMIRGVSQKVSLPFTLSIAGDTATMAGKLTLDRSLWGLGAGSWQDKSVENSVTVNVVLVAKKAG